MATATAHRHGSVVLHVGELHYATEKAVVERVLGRLPGVLAVEANPVAQTATVVFDPDQTSVAELAHWVEECGHHCAGRSVPGHVCDPLAQAEPLAPAHDHAAMPACRDDSALALAPTRCLLDHKPPLRDPHLERLRKWTGSSRRGMSGNSQGGRYPARTRAISRQEASLTG
jgi:copper chaperone CopZ